MPQMDFHNPLTTSQVVWMAVILVVLYVAAVALGPAGNRQGAGKPRGGDRPRIWRPPARPKRGG